MFGMKESVTARARILALSLGKAPGGFKKARMNLKRESEIIIYIEKIYKKLVGERSFR